jgi:acetyltransferase-like isoleucine patch superfamily enzyme
MIAETARIHPQARLGSNVTVGDFTVIDQPVEIGDGAVIDSHCILGYPTPLAEGMPLILGAGARVRSHSILYAGAEIGPGLVTGHHVTIREKSRIGAQCQIGSYGDIQGDLDFGDHSRTQSSVFIPKHSRIGRCVWLFPGVTLTNDPHPPSDPADLGVIIEDYAVLASRATVLPGIRIGTRALVAAQALVTRDVPADMVVAGVPARIVGPAADILLRDGSGQPAYPWTRHFHRGYPDELVLSWLADHPR